jgi:hypothetical protein
MSYQKRFRGWRRQGERNWSEGLFIMHFLMSIGELMNANGPTAINSCFRGKKKIFLN